MLTVLPHLARHLRSSNYVACTYAAVAIERILFIRSGTTALYVQVPPGSKNLPADFFVYSSFKPEDIQPFSGDLTNTVLTKLESAGSPEKLAENDFMMKCERILGHLLVLLFTKPHFLASKVS